MEVKFTKASKKDKYKVTVNLGQFTDSALSDLPELEKGTEFILYVDKVPTVFKVNREGKTAATDAFPRKFRSPTVGKPTIVEIEENIYVL